MVPAAKQQKGFKGFYVLTDRRNSIPRENSKNSKTRIIPFRGNPRLTEILQRRRFLGPEAYVFGGWRTGARVRDFHTAFESLVLLANGVKPERDGRKTRLTEECRHRFKQIDLHWHDFRHEALSRYGEGGMLLSELQALAGHSNPQTTKRYEHVESQRLIDAMQRARERREQRLTDLVLANAENRPSANV